MRYENKQFLFLMKQNKINYYNYDFFFQNGGHPCSIETAPEGSKRVYDPDMPIPSIPMTPQQFLELFPSP